MRASRFGISADPAQACSASVAVNDVRPEKVRRSFLAAAVEALTGGAVGALLGFSVFVVLMVAVVAVGIVARGSPHLLWLALYAGGLGGFVCGRLVGRLGK